MLVIRLTRIGKKNTPQYRIVVQEKQQSPSSKYMDQVGFYNPLTEPPEIKLEEEKIKQWIEKGAQPSNTVWNMLVNAEIVKGKKRKAVKVKTKKSKDSEEKKEESKAESPDETPEKKDDKPTEKPVEKPKEEEKKDEKPKEEPKPEKKPEDKKE